MSSAGNAERRSVDRDPWRRYERRRTALLMRTIPFALIAALGWVTVPLEDPDENTEALIVAGAVTVGLVITVFVLVWRRMPARTGLIIPFGSLIAIALLREAEGTAASGYAVLALAPVLWLALYGNRRELLAMIAAVAVMLIAPILIVGAPDYPETEWRKAILFTAVSAIVGLTTQKLVNDVREGAAAGRRRERYFRAVMDSAAEGIVAIDASALVMFANPAAARLTGYAVGELLGAHLHNLIHHSYADHTPYPIDHCPTMNVLKTGLESVISTDVYWRKDGTSFPVEYRSTPMVEDGEVVGVVNTFTDITERLAVERMKNEFVSVVSHELRTPLTSIRGSLGLMEGGVLGKLSDEAQEMLGIAITNADRLVRLINDILDVERIESGKAPLEMRECDLADLIDATCNLMAPAADAGEIELSFERASVQLFADPDRITQTLLNLVGNAVKFTPEGGSVTLTTELGDDAVTVRVADTGPGIPAEKRDEIFGRFAQIDSADARQAGGSGLGLAIARGIVQQHGGRIWVENRDGPGSVFAFELPLPRSQRRDDRDIGTDERLGALIVEDDKDLANVLAATLERHGVSWRIGGDVAEALRILRAESPELIVLDLMLPGSDGRALIERMRSEHRLEEATILVYTARDLSHAEVKELQTVAEVVTKSRVTSAEFERRMIDALERGRAVRAALEG